MGIELAAVSAHSTRGEASAKLLQPVRDASAVVGIMGLGYVGRPLANACAARGFRTVGFDIKCGNGR